MRKTAQTFSAIVSQKAFWLCIPFLVIPPLILLLIGEIKWAAITFSFVPLAFIIILFGVFVSKHLPSTRMHEITNHFTEDDHFPPFRGNIDWKAFTSALIDIGYKGPLMLESYIREEGESSDSFFGACRQAYEKLIELLAENLN